MSGAQRNEDLCKRLAAEGAEAAPGTPADLQSYVRAEYEKWGRVIPRVGIKGK